MENLFIYSRVVIYFLIAFILFVYGLKIPPSQRSIEITISVLMCGLGANLFLRNIEQIEAAGIIGNFCILPTLVILLCQIVINLVVHRKIIKVW